MSSAKQKGLYDILAQNAPQPMMTPMEAPVNPWQSMADDQGLGQELEQVPNYGAMMTPVPSMSMPNGDSSVTPQGANISASKKVSTSMPMQAPQDSQAPKDDYEAKMEDAYRVLNERNQKQLAQSDAEAAKLGPAPSGLAELDWSPMAALYDIKGYKAPTAQAEFEAKKNALSTLQDKRGEAQSKSLLDYLKMKAEGRNKQALMEAKLAGMSMGQQRLAMQGDRLVNSINNTFDNNPLMIKFQTAQAGIQRGLDSINNPPSGKITTQLVREMSNDIAQALAIGGQSAASDREHLEYKNLNTRWAGIMSQLSDAPDDVASPMLVQHIKDTLSRLDHGFAQNIAARAKKMGDGRHYNYGGANEAVQNKVGEYSSGQEHAPQGTPAPVQDPAARLAELRAKKNGG